MLNFLIYIGVSVGLLVVGLFVMEMTTKNKEFSLIAKGNKAAAYVLGGRLVGLGIVLYTVAAHSLDYMDMIAWGSIGIAAQIVVFYLAELLTPKFNITKSIDEDNQAVGVFLLLLSIAVGLVVAGCLTY
jgi:putative membrane protein